MTIRALTPSFALKYHFLLFVALVSGVAFVHSSAAESVSSPAFRISQQLATVEEAERQGASSARQGCLWATLAVAYQNNADADKALHAYEKALRLLQKDPASQANYATVLDNLGSMYLEYGRVTDAETVRKKALVVRRQLGNPLQLARSYGHMAEVELSLHKFKDAEKGALAAIQTISAAGDGRKESDLSAELSALITLTLAQCLESKLQDGLRSGERAKQLADEDFPGDSLERAHSLLAYGFAQWKSGATPEADQTLQEGIRLLKAQLGEKSPILIAAMFEYRDFLKANHRGAEVADLERKLSGMRSVQTPNPCGGCEVSVFALR